MNDEKRIEALEQALRDERVERDAAQRRAAESDERVAVWRKRAEERTDRIDKLVAERDQLRSVGGWMRAKAGRTVAGAPNISELSAVGVQSGEAPDGLMPSIPVIRCALLTSNENLARIWAETDLAVIDGGNVPPDADVVVIDAEALRTDTAVAALIEDWAQSIARPPLIVFDPTGEHAISQVADLVLGLDDVDTFDPAIENPMYARESLDQAADAAKADVRNRRRAFEYRAPWVLAHRFLNEAHVAHPAPTLSVAGLLVSMRPDDLRNAIGGFAAQDYRSKELVVVCHGFESNLVQDEIDSVDVSCEVFEAPSSVLLGDCLNLAAEATSAQILAKIDDDDHYGPGYLTDAADALHYSNAEIVGKAAHFTYVQAEDRTVLRHPGSEERFVSGAVAGGSLVLRRRVWEEVQFPRRPRRVDALFLRGARAVGASVYSGSRWDFVYNRRTADQTWRAEAEVFLSGSEAAWEGDHPTTADA